MGKNQSCHASIASLLCVQKKGTQRTQLISRNDLLSLCCFLVLTGQGQRQCWIQIREQAVDALFYFRQQSSVACLK
jgi:hypothetical protein